MATASKGKAAAKPKAKSKRRDVSLPKFQQKRAAGRPPIYEAAAHCARVTKLAMLGLNDAEIAQQFGISDETFYLWRAQHPEFVEALNAGKVDADANVAQSLYKRANGMATPAVKIFMPKDATDVSEAIYVPYAIHHPPDTNAARMWLHNRRPKDWRERREVEVTGGIEFRIAQMTPDERLARLKELQAKASLIIEGEATDVTGEE